MPWANRRRLVMAPSTKDSAAAMATLAWSVNSV